MLERPSIYRASQKLLSPDGERRLKSVVTRAMSELPPIGTVLDVGCGPCSLLGAKYGLDLSFSYASHFPGIAVVGSATSLPYRDNAFDAVVSFGLLHHLDECDAQRALSEMHRVASVWVLVTDPVLPHALSNPLAWIVRKLDRGGHVRSEMRLRALFHGWTIHRFRYTVTGLEGVLAYLRKA
jgi:SAM-dependent methyltransferase